MTTEELKNIAQMLKDFALAISVIVAGLWGYYQFVKGRLFSPKSDIDLKHLVVRSSGQSTIVTLNILVKNIGTVRLLPETYRLEVFGLHVNGDELKRESVYFDANLLPPVEGGRYNYVEPGETDIETVSFIVLEKYEVLAIEVTLFYKTYRICRSFFVPCCANAATQTMVSNVREAVGPIS